MLDLAHKIQVNTTNYIEIYFKGIKFKKSFREFYGDVVCVARMLQNSDVKSHDKVAVFGRNSYEWLVTDIACLLSNVTLVALPESFTEEMIQSYCSRFEVKKIYSDCTFDNKELNDMTALLSELDFSNSGDQTFQWPAFEENRKFTIVFSSGTTGIPKSLALRFDSVEKTIMTAMKYLNFQSDDKNLCFLPLSIFTSRMYIYSALMLGFNLTITNADYMFSALRIYEPSIMQGVPYFFENVYFRFQTGLQESLKKRIIKNLYYGSKKLHINPVANKLKHALFQDIQRIFGKNMRCMITGTAPISESTLRFYQEMNIHLYESYGLNETGVLTVNYPGHEKVGSVGVVLPHYEIVIDEQDQITVKSDYFWSDGYLEEENAGKFKINEKGYYETGDTGYLDSENFLFITGRCVDTITLKNGMKVNPQRIENILNKKADIKQSMVFSSDLKKLTAIIVKMSDQVTDQDIEKQIEQVQQELDTKEQIANIICTTQQFSVENGFLTANLKLNRKEIIKAYADK